MREPRQNSGLPKIVHGPFQANFWLNEYGISAYLAKCPMDGDSILELQYIQTSNTIPHRNLALEEYMFENIGNNQCILYLWQNRHTVVIGKNQNAFKECKVNDLEASGGFLARRPSGGGSVYHDLGNLNFTFITTSDHYDVDKQLGVIVEAVKSFGIQAEKSGRNDITIDGRKFSGNAFLQKNDKRYHHGTILVNVDMAKMGLYLNVSAKKLKAKGVDSVKSRVVNLADLNPDITIESMGKALISAFEKIYGGKATPLSESAMDQKAVETLYEKYASDSWRYGEKHQADYEFGDKFDWGEISLHLTLKGHIIEAVKVYTDAMDVDFARLIESRLTRLRFEKGAMVGHLMDSDLDLNILKDVVCLIMNEDF